MLNQLPHDTVPVMNIINRYRTFGYRPLKREQLCQLILTEKESKLKWFVISPKRNSSPLQKLSYSVRVPFLDQIKIISRSRKQSCQELFNSS